MRTTFSVISCLLIQSPLLHTVLSQVTKVLISQFCPASCYAHSLTFKRLVSSHFSNISKPWPFLRPNCTPIKTVNKNIILCIYIYVCVCVCVSNLYISGQEIEDIKFKNKWQLAFPKFNLFPLHSIFTYEAYSL